MTQPPEKPYYIFVLIHNPRDMEEAPRREASAAHINHPGTHTIDVGTYLANGGKDPEKYFLDEYRKLVEPHKNSEFRVKEIVFQGHGEPGKMNNLGSVKNLLEKLKKCSRRESPYRNEVYFKAAMCSHFYPLPMRLKWLIFQKKTAVKL